MYTYVYLDILHQQWTGQVVFIIYHHFYPSLSKSVCIAEYSKSTTPPWLLHPPGFKIETSRTHYMLQILDRFHQLLGSGYTITFVCVLSHIERHCRQHSCWCNSQGSSLCQHVCDIREPFTDFQALVRAYTNSSWQQPWSENKLFKCNLP